FVPENERLPQEGDWAVVSSEDAVMIVKLKIPVKGKSPSEDEMIDVDEARTISKGRSLHVLKFEGDWAWVARPSLQDSLLPPGPGPEAPPPKEDGKGETPANLPPLGPSPPPVPAPGSAPAPPAPAPSATESKPSPRIDVDPHPKKSPPGDGAWIKRKHL